MYKNSQLFLKKLSLLIFIASFVSFFDSCKKETPKPSDSQQHEENKTLDKYSNYEIYIKLLEKINEKPNYYITTSGQTNAKYGVISYKQLTTTSVYAHKDFVYNNIDSTSTLVNHQHRLLVKNKEAHYFDSENDKVEKISVDEYLEIYGLVPNIETLFNYKIEENLIISSSRDVLDNVNIITLELNPIITKLALGKQMQMFGNLASEPEFDSIELLIYFDNDFNILKFKNNDKYAIEKKIPVLGVVKMKCVQELESEISYNYDFDFDLLNEFE